MTLKYMTIAEDLRKEIAIRGPQGNPKLPTEAELMRMYQVSRQTVRQALSVLLSEGLIEKRQGSGTYISPAVFPAAASSRDIVLLIPESSSPAASREIQDMQAIFNESGYSISVCSTENRTAKEREILLNLLEKPARGLLAQGVRTALPNPNLPLYRKLLEKGTAIVFLGAMYPELKHIHTASGKEFHVKKGRDLSPAAVLEVTADCYNGGWLLAQHLLSLGHKKIAGIFRLDNLSSRAGYAGVLHALCENKLPFDDRNFLWYDPLMTKMPDSRLLLSFIRIQLASCTAVICENEAIAEALIHELEKLGLSVPQHISVAALGSEVPDESGRERHITRAVCPDSSCWKTAARLLKSQLHGSHAESITCTMNLQGKESTGVIRTLSTLSPQSAPR